MRVQNLRTIWLLTPLLIAAVGCTHKQLRRSTVGQVGTVSDIYQQQVLNNLAKFVYDSNALPDFGVPTDGLAQIDDSASFNNDWRWQTLAGEYGDFKFGASRGIRQSWSLKPVQDPRKLELMRCAYRRAVGHADCESCCIECEKRFRNFYTGDICKAVPEPCRRCEPSACVDPRATCDATSSSDGTVTSRCLGSCWFHVGCSNCLDKIRKDNPCCLIGEHCGTVVWVCPGRGSDELSKLTIAILDYAVNDPRKVETAEREVTGYFNKEGVSVTKADAVFEIKARLPVTQGSESEAEGAADGLRYLLLGKPATAADAVPLEAATTMLQSPPSEINRSKAAQQLQLLPGAPFE